jgi:Asp-tRNA(Asn)/Glu-tRNA(Gln) amidotransferase A subunit family amidase
MVSSGAELGPLHGIPTATKINTDHTGYATTIGIEALDGLPTGFNWSEDASTTVVSSTWEPRSSGPVDR